MVDSRVDFPALGSPTKPTSAINFNLSQTDFSRPGHPGKALRGDLLVDVLYLRLPKPPSPPRARIKVCPTSTRSTTTVDWSSSRICVPFGSLSTMSAPATPDF